MPSVVKRMLDTLFILCVGTANQTDWTTSSNVLTQARNNSLEKQMPQIVYWGVFKVSPLLQPLWFSSEQLSTWRTCQEFGKQQAIRFSFSPSKATIWLCAKLKQWTFPVEPILFIQNMKVYFIYSKHEAYFIYSNMKRWVHTGIC